MNKLFYLLLFIPVIGFSQNFYSVEYESQADIKIFVVDYESQCDLKIFFVKYKSQSGWKNNSKKQLLY